MVALAAISSDMMLLNHTNQTVKDLFSCYSPLVVGYRYFAVMWGCAVSVTGTVGNLMTILAFVSDPRLRTRFNVLIVNLAFADLLYCTILQPISVDSYLHLRWRSGEVGCRVFGLLLFLSNSVSITSLCLLAVGRYLLVAKRQLFDRVFSKHGVIFLLISAWVLGLASVAPLWPVFVFVPQVCTCSFHQTRGRPYSTILLFFCFFIGLGCVGVFYLLIYKRVRVASVGLLHYRLSRHSSRKKPASCTVGTDDSGVAEVCSCEVSSQVESTQDKCEISFKNSTHTPPTVVPPQPSPSPMPALASGDNGGEFRRVTRMCFTVFLCFAFCFVPFLLLNIVDRQNRAPQMLHMFCANLTWLNSCINPLLYAVMNRQFRQGYYVLLTKVGMPFERFQN